MDEITVEIQQFNANPLKRFKYNQGDEFSVTSSH